MLDAVKPQVIFDLVSPQAFDLPAELYMGINVDARRVLLRELAATESVRALVFNSTAGVVHDSYSDLIEADETLPVLFLPQQREVYSHSKAVAETLVLEANGISSRFKDVHSTDNNIKTPLLLTASIRICSPFGANHGEVIKPIVENARAGRYRFQMGNGKNLSDWTYIENGVRGHVLAAEKLLVTSEEVLRSISASTSSSPTALLAQRSSRQRVDGEAFFVTNDECVPFWAFARKVGAAAGHPTKEEDVRSIPRPLGMFMAFIAEWVTWLKSFGTKKSSFTRTGVRYSTIERTYRIDKAKERLGYAPFVTLDEGIKRATKPYIEEKKKDD